MDKITQDNAALAQQSAESGEELKQQAEQVRQAVAELLRMAQGGEAVAVTAPTAIRRPATPTRSPAARRTGAKPVGATSRPSPAAASDDLSFKDA